MDTRSYLVEMHDALGELRSIEANAAPFDLEIAVAAYGRYITALSGLRPPPLLADAHNAIANACRAMLTHLGDPDAQQRLEGGSRNEQLEAAAEAGGAAYRRLQAAADKLGLTLWFV